MSEIIDFPTLAPNSMDLDLSYNVKEFMSPFSRVSSQYEYASPFWVASLSYDTLDNGLNKRNEIDEIMAFLWSLKQSINHFLMPVFYKKGIQYQGKPIVEGDNQTGNILLTSGWYPRRLVLSRGDYFQVGNELKFIVEDCISTDAGVCVLKFLPELRVIPQDGDNLTLNKPKGLFKLSTDSNTSFSLSKGVEGSIGFDVEEVV